MVYYDSRFRCVVDDVPCSAGCPGAQQRGQTVRASKERGGVRSRITASKICDMGIEGWYPREWRQSAERSGFEARRMELLELVWSTFKSTLWIG
jgi:hypothetical protein